MAEIRDIKRLNYFTGQFLVEKDFNDEQAYHVDMRRLHNRWLHSWGVANGGLQVEKKADKTLAVAAGLAIDKDGNEIVVLKPHEVSLDSAVAANATVYVTARYQDVMGFRRSGRCDRQIQAQDGECGYHPRRSAAGDGRLGHSSGDGKARCERQHRERPKRRAQTGRAGARRRPRQPEPARRRDAHGRWRRQRC